MPEAERQLRGFIAKFDSPGQALIRALRKAMRARLPGAWELVYDNYNFFVIGYSPTERPSDMLFSIAAAASGVNLFFAQGAKLADPKGVLEGDGKQVRFIRVRSASELDRPEVKALMAAQMKHGRAIGPAAGKLVIRSVSAKQRPRRRAAGAPTGRVSGDRTRGGSKRASGSPSRPPSTARRR